jgi:Tol biopolymer transport system component
MSSTKHPFYILWGILYPRFLSIVFTLLIAGCGAMNASTIPQSTDSGQIAFSAADMNIPAVGGGWEIYLVNADGANLRQVTSAPNAFHFSLAPNGELIAFSRMTYTSIVPPSIAGQICTVRVDGTQMRCLGDTSARDGLPVWSPDGKHIAFVSNRDESTQIYVMNADGSNVVKQTTISEGVWLPAWSPDGKQLAFIGKRNPTFIDLYVLTIEGTELQMVQGDYRFPDQPVWSPDGKYIAFVAMADKGDGWVYVVDTDGSDVRKLGQTWAVDSMPVSWSPDSKHIAYIGHHNYVFGVYVVSVEDGVPRHMVDLYAPDAFADELIPDAPVWSPDGKRIAFLGIYDLGAFTTDIFLINPDGTDLRRVTTSDLLKANLAWLPES